MRRWLAAAWCVLGLAPVAAIAQPDASAPRIAGFVDGGHDESGVVVVLCDQATGVPIDRRTWKPVAFGGDDAEAAQPVTTLSERNRFAFEGVGPGEYRLVAQKWTGPFNGLLEVNGSVIQLFGVAERVRVPSAEAQNVRLTPLGDGVLHLDGVSGNSGTFLVLSMRPTAADPILGFAGWDDDFVTHAIGVNRMPSGRTMVLGLPRGKVYAAFFAADNSPGFASAEYDVQPIAAAPQVQFVAGWSNAQHDPPPRIAEVMAGLPPTKEDVMRLVGADIHAAHADDLHALLLRIGPLDRRVPLPNGQQAILADVLAAQAYRDLQRMIAKRSPPPAQPAPKPAPPVDR